jgi:hypothetical protein
VSASTIAVRCLLSDEGVGPSCLVGVAFRVYRSLGGLGPVASVFSTN